MNSTLSRASATAMKRAYADHPKTRVGGVVVLAVPEALLSKREYDAEKSLFLYALSVAESNLTKIRDAKKRLDPFEYSEKQNRRVAQRQAKDAYEDVLFRINYLRNGLAYIERLWKSTQPNVENARGLLEKMKQAKTVDEARAIYATIIAEAQKAKQSQSGEFNLLSQEHLNVMANTPPPASTTVPPTDEAPLEMSVDIESGDFGAVPEQTRGILIGEAALGMLVGYLVYNQFKRAK